MNPPTRIRYSISRLPLYVLISLSVSSTVLGRTEPVRSVSQLVAIVDGLKAGLGMGNNIQIKIVQSNGLAVSVQPVDRNRRDFMMLVDAGFLNQLDDEEVTAALSHELGHVWIYTHHPFLHTETLANQIAMKVTTRDSLQKLYLKLAQFKGGNLSAEELPSRLQ